MGDRQSSLNRYEKILKKHAQDSMELSWALADASYKARLAFSCNSEHLRHLRDVTAGVIAPVLVSFVLWILHRAKLHGTECLYFLSRDGQILHLIAEQIIDKNPELSCDAKYLYVSRLSLGRACLSVGAVDDSWVWSDTDASTGEQMLERIGTSLEEVSHLLPKNEIDKFKNRPIPKEVEQTIKNRILPLLRNGRVNAEKAHLDLAVEYLRQEGLDRNTSVGLVDVGWKGSIHAMINHIAREGDLNQEPMWGFFFGLVPSGHGLGAYREAFFFDEVRGKGDNPLKPGPDMYGLMEAFCAADHGTVIGYQADASGQIIPVLESTWAERMERWGLKTVWKTTSHFIDSLTNHADFQPNDSSLYASLTEIIEQFWCNPTAEEAKSFGKFPRELGQGKEKDFEPLATSYRWRDILAFVRHGREADKALSHHYTWHAGSMMVTPPPIRNVIRRVLKTGRAVKSGLRLLAGLRDIHKSFTRSRSAL